MYLIPQELFGLIYDLLEREGYEVSAAVLRPGDAADIGVEIIRGNYETTYVSEIYKVKEV